MSSDVEQKQRKVPYRKISMQGCIADPSTTARWSAARQSDKIIPQWSLRQSCLSKVKDSVLGWSRRRKNSVDYQSNEQNPFLQYPINLRHELLHQLMRLKPTGRELLKAAELLVYSGVPSFDLSCLDDCKFQDVQTMLNILTRTGSILQELTLAGQWLYQESSAELVQSILESTINLQRLRIQHATAKGRELVLVFKNCPKLKKLEIMHPSIDEECVESLVQVMEQDAVYESARQNLTELRLPSSVRGNSILTLLKAFPNLEYISCTYLDEMLDELEEHGDDEAWWKERTSKIRGLIVSLPVCDDTIPILIEWFPNLEEISLEVQEDMSLQTLASLPNLRSLELKNSPTLPTSYIDEVLPLLAACGKQLLALSLERFDIVDLAKTALYCPNLRCFSGQYFTLLGTSIGQGSKKPFFNLRHLRLRPRVNRKVTPEACEILLTNSQSLHHLEFYCCYGLTDSLVSELVKSNKFTALKTLLLRHGHGLSSAGILQLTRNAENLRSWDVGMVSTKLSATGGGENFREQ